jgi:hypothetical protein
MRQRRRDKKIAAAREEAASREAKVQQQPVRADTTTATTTSTENTFTKTGLKEYMQQMEPQDKKQQQIKSPVVRPQPTPPRKKPNRAQSSPHAQRKYHAAPVSPRQQARPREDTAHDNKAHLARKIRKQVLKEGYLLKQSPQGNWNKRYFMLLPHVILYCKRASDVAEGGKIARIIIHSDQDHQGTLHTPVVLTPDQKDNIASKYWNSLFAISPPARDHERPKLHVMAAKNEAVHAEWVQLIQEVLDRE